MSNVKIDELKGRTEQKLRFAQIHLDELENMPEGRGHDFERAHHEAFLAQLFGAYAALLQELNQLLDCQLSAASVSLGKMRNALSTRGLKSGRLRELYDLEKDPESWFAQAKEMRDHTTHVAGLALAYHKGGPLDGVTALRPPRLDREHTVDARQLLAQWHREMDQLVARFRDVTDDLEIVPNGPR